MKLFFLPRILWYKNRDTVVILYRIGLDYIFQVYCDMLSDDGPWILVASIHDKSSAKDCERQSNWQDGNGFETFTKHVAKNVLTILLKWYILFAGQNWINAKTFGRLEDVPAKEYKSLAYSHVKVTLSSSDRADRFYCRFVLLMWKCLTLNINKVV